MRERYDELSQYGYQVLVIAPHKGSFVQEFLNQFGDYPFPFYGDPEKQAYREVGAKSMPKSKLLMKSLKGFVKGSISNVMPKEKGQKDVVMKSMKSEDVSIQGATLVFDENGNTIHMHLDSSPEDHISVNQLFQILEQQKS
ncbi:peroxiredoxin [Alkalibacillus almallahensis]|nr:peroxiredoxin [Alkalibacillus almallahensis]